MPNEEWSTKAGRESRLRLGDADLGTGYLGATYAICYAELGYEVLGFDVDAEKIAKLNAGEVPIAFVQLKAGAQAAPDELREFCRQEIPELRELRPGHWVACSQVS